MPERTRVNLGMWFIEGIGFLVSLGLALFFFACVGKGILGLGRKLKKLFGILLEARRLHAKIKRAKKTLNQKMELLHHLENV